ncbi:MAG TPA: MFS transporter [Roseiflexaceae bacterium]|nr:MFS transporter [Roseiflexaceae bacterium]
MMQTDDPTRPERTTPLWKNRDYMLLWSGQTVSIIGTHVSQIAFPLLVLALTHSPAQAGFVAAARSLPYLLFTLLAGALVDRWDRKVTMIVCSALSAIALASIAVAAAFGSLTIAQLVIVSFVEGTCAVFFRLAETSALPQVVSKAQLPAAIAQQQAQYAVGAIAGPPLGGALYSTAQLLPFVVDACSYAASCLSLTAIRTRFQAARTAVRRSLRAEIGEGVAWLWRHALIRYMAFLTGGINFITAGAALLVIVLAAQQGASAALTGAIFAAAGAGGILGAVIAPLLQRRLSFGQLIIGACWCYALVWALLPAAATPALLMVLVSGASLASLVYDTVQMSYRLALIPDGLQGRVNSVFRLVADGSKTLGVAATGILLESLGTTSTILISAVLLAALATLTLLNRHVRAAPPQTALKSSF